MTLWFIFALMTAAAAFAVLWPLGRGPRKARAGSETAVYKDQLAEIQRDAAAGLIGAAEAEAARIEIGRRLIAAAEADKEAAGSPRLGLRRAVAVVALVGVPLVAVAIYLPLGSPALGDFPLAARTGASLATTSIDNLVTQVEAHLEKNPTDGRGWSVLAPVLTRLGRYDDAVRAYRNAIAYAGETAARRADLGEALTAAANGVVTADAKTEFDRAVALDANEAKARYFLGLAAEQDGRVADAAMIWRTMLATAPEDAPWRPLVQAALTRVSAQAPKLSNEAVAAASGMSDEARNAMVRSMVERLALRLKDNRDDVDGWLRLIRAYMVLGDRDKAQSVSAEARQEMSKDADRLRALNEGLKALGLDG